MHSVKNTPPPPRRRVSVAIMVRFEGPLGGEAQVLGLLLGQLGQLHSQFI